jgi:hypothetical protein
MKQISGDVLEDRELSESTVLEIRPSILLQKLAVHISIVFLLFLLTSSCKTFFTQSHNLSRLSSGLHILSTLSSLTSVHHVNITQKTTIFSRVEFPCEYEVWHSR